MELNPREDFEEHLEHLLETIEDEDLRALLRDQTSTILECSGGSEREQRIPIREALRRLIDERVQAGEEAS